ncbi:alcohol dehydrogenase catalytic domain-containing protein, partial [Rhizobium ruizarguesonis]
KMSLPRAKLVKNFPGCPVEATLTYLDVKVRARSAPPADELKVLGWDAAGIVKAIGADVTLFKHGDEVFYSGVIRRPGSNAEFHLVDERI